MNNPFQAKWSSAGQTMCLGHWEITFNGLPLVLPEERRNEHMNTDAIYNFIDPDDELYREGLEENDWIIENAEWLADVFIHHDIPIEEEMMRFFYHAVNKQDWRCGSCGGCI